MRHAFELDRQQRIELWVQSRSLQNLEALPRTAQYRDKNNRNQKQCLPSACSRRKPVPQEVHLAKNIEMKLDVKNNTAQFQTSFKKNMYIRLDWTGSFFTGSCPSTSFFFIHSLSLICNECNSLDSLLSSPSGTVDLFSHRALQRASPANTTYPFPGSRHCTHRCRHRKILRRRCTCDTCTETHSFMAAARHFSHKTHRTSGVLEVRACTRNRRKPSQQPRASSRCSVASNRTTEH